MPESYHIKPGLAAMLFRSHPWHGVPLGPEKPEVVSAYIELVPSDTVKYELDKRSGHLKVDRPQTYSNVCPTLYGMLPQTYCGDKVAQLSMARAKTKGIKGDQDPLDICVLTEKLVPQGDIFLQARPIGGIGMLDFGEADDKIIAVMQGDALHDHWSDITDCPPAIIERLEHYFLTYKMAPGEKKSKAKITEVYNKAEAYRVIEASYEDYLKKYEEVKKALDAVLGIK